jgi:hypothetical protein
LEIIDIFDIRSMFCAEHRFGKFID